MGLTASPSLAKPMSVSSDPAGPARWATVLLLAVLLWPLAVLTEFKPWGLFDARSLRSTGHFLASFVPPRMDAEFLALLLRETWRTVAIATAGMTLAWVIAVPLALGSTARLSVSALAQSMSLLPVAVRAPAGYCDLP